MRHQTSDARHAMGRLPLVGRLALLAAVPLGLATCDVSSLRGPQVVPVGTEATYTMRYSSPVPPPPVLPGNFIAFVVADVPAGWALVSSDWTGTVNGAPDSRTGTVVPPEQAPGVCPDLPPVAPGYQRLYLSTGLPQFPTVLATDFADISLRFQVGDTPGAYVLSFWGTGISLGGFLPIPCQGTPATLDVATIEPVPMAGGPAEIALVTLMVALGVFAVLNRERRQSPN